jgi:hypothetical protein
MNIYSRLVGVSVIVAIAGSVSISAFAQTGGSLSSDQMASAFRYYKDITVPEVKVPTVVDIPFTGDFLERFEFALFDSSSQIFEPVYLRQIKKEILVGASSNSFDSASAMIDGNGQTYAQFLMPDIGIGSATINLISDKPITTTALTMLLDEHVAMPLTAELRAVVQGTEQVVLARTRIYDTTLRFPKTTSANWNLTLTYGQPLRISELHFYQANQTAENSRSIRFLVQPGHTQYRLYFSPDRYAPIITKESGNLSSDVGVKRIGTAGQTTANTKYTMADTDRDGISDLLDNCVNNSNLDQMDVDGNGRGDVCDDFDRDGYINMQDNCRDLPNANQADTDSDGIGDVCDGQESRVTEQYKWLPWVGMGFAGAVLILLFALTARSMKKGGGVPPTEPPQA